MTRKTYIWGGVILLALLALAYFAHRKQKAAEGETVDILGMPINTATNEEDLTVGDTVPTAVVNNTGGQIAVNVNGVTTTYQPSTTRA
jgi:hypothetical protein